MRRQTSVEVTARMVVECSPCLPPECQRGVVISFGVNDTSIEDGRTRVSPERSVVALGQAVEQARDREWSVLVVGPPPIADAAQNERTAALDELFAERCSSLGIGYLSTIAALREDAVWMAQVEAGDGAHPAAEGYARMADLVWPSWVAWVERLVP